MPNLVPTNGTDISLLLKLSRFSHRIIPAERVCKAVLTDIKENCAHLFKRYFQDEIPKTVIYFPILIEFQFAIVFKCRNNKDVDKKQCIDEIAGDLFFSLPQVEALVGPSHKVNLSDPDLAIIVEIFKVKRILFFLL
jgi:tRNA(Ser,Leu) C12 N-acetylase TAN1